MTDLGFTHLHLHSEYSLLDGGNRMKPLIAKIAELGMKSVALTDHGNLFGAVEFYQACKESGIKPILGIEAYVAPDVVTERSDRRHKETQGVADGGFHLVLLAENQEGWRNLVKLSSDSYLEGFYYRPRMDKETLANWNAGLIAINGHLGSSIAYYLDQFVRTGAKSWYEQARAEAEWHASVFTSNERGEPRFFLELQRHETPEQHAINPHILALAEQLDLPVVCDNDAHFLTAEDWDAHDTLVCVSTGKSKNDERRLHYPVDLFVRSPEQMIELFTDIPEALRNSQRIAERCNVELDFSSSHAPLVEIRRRVSDPTTEQTVVEGTTAWFQAVCSTFELLPMGGIAGSSEETEARKKDCDAALRELAEAGLVWRYGRDGITAEHRARLERELTVLADKGISAYFLIVWDFVNEAHRRGVPAQARGSGVGTMVGYAIGLSNACPVKYGLLFERFTDPDRSEYPDIDIDLCQDGRAEILDYVRDKYGYVAQIITFGTMKARAAIRDVGRVLELPLPEVDRICKLIGDQLGTTLSEALEREPELKQLYRNDPAVSQVIDTALRLEGIVRHSGVHAAGVVIATQPLENLVPLATAKQQGQREILVTQWDGPTVEKMGLLKMDFLGLKTLSVLERARQLVSETLSAETIRSTVSRSDGESWDPLDLDRIDFTDQRVLAIYRRGETIGTFQFESDGMRNLLLKMKPDRLEDLVAANALFRPGPMALIDDYCDRKAGRQVVTPVHEIVDRFTADTYGIMVYQEQVMQIVHELGGVPLREAYSLIKAISKKKESTINATRQRFVAGADERGLGRRQADQLFDLILRFAGYGFNKSHSVGYSILAFQTAFLKTYFPIQYMAAVLTFEADNTDKLSIYLDECKRVLLPNSERGIEVAPPDINLSRIRFQVVFAQDEPHGASNGHIRFGLSAVKGVGIKAVEAILQERDSNGPFIDLWDFCDRVSLQAVNRSTMEALVKAGAFDSSHGQDQRAALVEALEGAIRSGQRAAAERESGQSNLFGEAAAEEAPPVRALPSVPPWTSQEMLRHEKAALGFFASRHPLEEFLPLIQRLRNASTGDLQDLDADMEVWVGAMVSAVRVTRTRKGRNPGQKMAMLTLEDELGKVEAVAFADVFSEIESTIEADGIYFFRARVDRRREEPTLVISQLITLEQAPMRLARELLITLTVTDEAELESESLKHELERLKTFLREERRHVNGTSAQLALQIEAPSRVFRIVTADYKIPLRPDLEQRVREQLGDRGRCELRGPGPPRLAAPEPKPWERPAVS